MRVVVAGASGFLGGAWTRALSHQGHEVVRLVRRPPASSDESRWDPASGTLDPEVVASADVVANLAGTPLVHVPWTSSYARTFVSARVDTTRTLAEAVARSPRRPTLLVQCGVSHYGDRGSQVIDEATPTDADGFMAEVSRQWEAATAPASDAGARVALMRSGAVLDRRGGAIRSMLPVFRLGLGGTIGDGSHYFPTISLDDWMGAATHLALREDLAGAFNVSGPDASTNAEFTRALGKALHRPTVMRAPRMVFRKALGPPGAVIVESSRVEPRRLLEAGYAFAHNDIHDRVAAALR